MSHDWPQGIENYGDKHELFRRKPFFRGDSDKGILGSPPMAELLRNLRPTWWFSAHLHVRFEATVHHDSTAPATGGSAPVPPPPVQNPEEIAIDDEFDAPPTQESREAEHAGEDAERARANPDEITLDDEEAAVAPPPLPPSTTRFLALDKCLPNRQFLEVSMLGIRCLTLADLFPYSARSRSSTSLLPPTSRTARTLRSTSTRNGWQSPARSIRFSQQHLSNLFSLNTKRLGTWSIKSMSGSRATSESTSIRKTCVAGALMPYKSSP